MPKELGTFVVPKITGAPSGVEGQLYHDAGTHKVFVYNGTSWVDLTVQGGAVVLTSASVAFTTNDTWLRLTISNGSVTTSSKIVGTITRGAIADGSDPGYVYLHNIVNVQTGTFELIVACFGLDLLDPADKAPNETVTFNYTLG